MEDESSLHNLTVLELQQECKRRGLKKNGIKAKLIHRLSEYIDKYGPDYIEPTEKVVHVSEPSVEKSVLTIHNPHPYMQEYEEQLIENVDDEADVNNFFKKKNVSRQQSFGEVKEVKNVDYADTPDSDAPLPYLEAPDSDAPLPSADTPDSDVVPLPYAETPDSDAQLPGSPTYPATGNFVRDPRDMAEEFTEPIHQSPTYCKSPNDRIIKLPDDHMCDEDVDAEYVNGEDVDAEVDTEEVDAEEKADIDEMDEKIETNSHEDDDSTFRTITGNNEQMDEIKDDINEALHTGMDAEVEADDALDYADVEDENNIEEMQYNEPENYEENEEVNEDNEDEEVNEENEDEEVNEENEEEEVNEENEDEEVNEENIDEEVNEENEDEEVNEENEYEEVNEENEDEEADEENEGNEENDEFNAMEEEETVEKEDDGDYEHYEEEHDENMKEEIDNESRDIEDGEITINIENHNDFEERQGDDHLDVSIQDYKIIEDNEAEDTGLTTKIPKKTVVPVSLKKRISLVASTESPEERAARRKRRWGSTSTSMKESGVAISSESIKKLIPDMKIDAAALESVPELDYQEDDVIENITEVAEENIVEVDTPENPSPPKIYKAGRSVKVDKEKKITLEKPTLTTPDVVTVESDSGDVGTTPSTPGAHPPKPIRNYVVDDEVEVQEEREKSPSPAKNPSSQYIHIENLVRPYTISQLKSVIGRTGHICDGGFWINNIKSQCYVKLSSELESAATRDALHGLRWPAGSPKLLKIDFAINEQMYKETTGLLGEKPKIVIEIEDKDNDQVVITNERTRGPRREDNNYDRRMRNEGKKRMPPPKEPEKERPKEKKDCEREESPAKLLDDLFRKTKATPCIYWLPLTEEQIVKLSNIRAAESQRR